MTPGIIEKEIIMNTKTLTLSTLFCLVLWLLFFNATWPSESDPCTTDSDCGCIDDCLEPLKVKP